MRAKAGLLIAVVFLASCGGSDESPTSPSPGTGTLAIAPQTDFLTIGTSLVFEARLTEAYERPRIVAADWSSQDGRVAAVDRQGRVTALASGTTTLRAVFDGRTATLDLRVAPNFAGTWTGQRRVVACLHPSPTVCSTTYPPGRQAATTLVLTQARERVTGLLTLAPPATSPSASVTGDIAPGGQLVLTGTIISTPVSGATTTLGTLVDWRSEIDVVQPTIFRGSFVEQRSDSDLTQWRVTWEFLGLIRQ